jgi:hypothetical protein
MGVQQGLPSPPADEKPNASRKNSSTGSKMPKSQHRVTKRVGSVASTVAHAHDATGMDGRHKRVWKACERCRMKKTKCDGEFPCKRCKDDGLVCTAGIRKKTEYKQLPRGYAEVLENTQFALIATVHKLYSMVRNQQTWDLGEPELNDRGQPVIHNIAQRLGCIRPNSDVDLPVHSVFPEDEAGMAELARQLEEQQQQQPHLGQHHDSPVQSQNLELSSSSSGYNRGDRASSSEFDHSDFELDYRKQAFGSSNNVASSTVTLSPQSFTTSADFEFSNAPSSATDVDTTMMFPALSPQQGNFPQWAAPAAAGQTPNDLALHFMQQAGSLQSIDMLSQGLMESDFGTIKPHILSSSNAGVMMGMGDPMIYSGYDGESMRL